MLLRVYKTTVRVCNYYVNVIQASYEMRVYKTRGTKIWRVYKKSDFKGMAYTDKVFCRTGHNVFN